MQGNGNRDGETGKSGNFVDDAVGVIGRGAHEEDGVGIDKAANFCNRDSVGGGRARNGVELDIEVGGGLVERGVGSGWDDPEVLSGASTLKREPSLHFGLCDTSLNIRLLSRCETSHQDRLCTTTRGSACAV